MVVLDVVTFIVWLIIGIFAGLLASWAMNSGRYGWFLNVVVGATGALIGGILVPILIPVPHEPTRVYLSLLVAGIGAVICLAGRRALLPSPPAVPGADV